VNINIGIILGLWLGIGAVVGLDCLFTGLGIPMFVDWNKLSRRGQVIAGFLLLPWIVILVGIGGPIVLFVHCLKEIRDVLFYSKEERTTPIFKALKLPFVWLYRESGVSEHKTTDGDSGE
jgi:hypothetical protein